MAKEAADVSLVGYDIDGTLVDGPLPADCQLIISGRTFAEYDDTCRNLARAVPVYIRGSGGYGDRQHAGEFKAAMIARLGVTTYHEDDPLQAEIILRQCPNCTVALHGAAAEAWRSATVDG